VAQDYKPCRLLQSMPSTELADFIFEENVQPQHISQVSYSLPVQMQWQAEGSSIS
jgi:hypothetical protein